MKRVWLIGLSTMALAASLAAQGRVSGGPAPSSGTDARVGAGGIRTGNPNILYPGSPRGGQPGSILTPGTPRSPAASRLPGTPGASIHGGSNRSSRQLNGQFRRGRGFGGRGGSFGRGFGFGGGLGFGGGFGFGGDLDYDPGDFEDEREEARREARRETEGPQNRNSYVVGFPGAGSQQSPRPRVYDVRETQDGRVEMTPIGPGVSPAAAPVAAIDYWLIALKGGLIYAAMSYEERDETFRFQTLDAKQFVVPLAEVDLAFTEKLNSDLGREFNLR